MSDRLQFTVCSLQFTAVLYHTVQVWYSAGTYVKSLSMQLIHDAIASGRPRNHNDTKYLWKMLLRVHYRTKRGNEVHSIALSKLGYLNDGSCAGVVPHAIDMLVCWYVGIGLLVLVCWYVGIDMVVCWYHVII